jgi:excisionase family DNA binding protein
MEDMLLTVPELAKTLKTNPEYVYKLINKGYLPVLKLGRYKVRISALEKFLEENEGKDLTDLDNVVELELKG